MRTMLVHSVQEITLTKQFTVVLRDEAMQTALVIWIGVTEASVIANTLSKQMSPRPLTLHLLVNLLKATGVQLEEVRIDAIKDEVFYATVKVRNGDVVQEVEARPSDAIALALLLERPIAVSEEVLANCGIVIPEHMPLEQAIQDKVALETVKVQSILGPKMDVEMVQQMALLNAQLRTGTPEERQAAGQKLLTLLMGEVTTA